MSVVETSFVFFDIISLVLQPRQERFELHYQFGRFFVGSKYLKAIDKLKIVAIGFAIFLPSISGADP